MRGSPFPLESSSKSGRNIKIQASAKLKKASEAGCTTGAGNSIKGDVSQLKVGRTKKKLRDSLATSAIVSGFMAQIGSPGSSQLGDDSNRTATYRTTAIQSTLESPISFGSCAVCSAGLGSCLLWILVISAGWCELFNGLNC